MCVVPVGMKLKKSVLLTIVHVVYQIIWVHMEKKTINKI